MSNKKLDSKRILKKLEKGKEKLKKEGVKRIGLFGSYLHGKQKRNSDIDFLVTFENVEGDNYFEVWNYLEELFGRKVDLIIEKNLIERLKYVKQEAEYARL